MKVSILMAVYNGENYLEEAIASALSQSYPDVEIVICNDGSTDATRQLLDQYRDQRNITILHDAHCGKVHAFNRAFEACSGDAICFLAHDDVLPPDSIKERVSFMNETHAWAVYCNGDICTAEMKTISPLVTCPKNITWDEDKTHICRNNFLAGALLLIRREIAESVFPIPEHLQLEDWWVVFNTLYYAGRIEYLDRPLFHYRLHGKNDTGMPPVDDFDNYLRRHWKKHIDYYDQLRLRLDSFKIPDEERERLGNIIRMNKQVVENTLGGKYTFPSMKLVRATGIPKYLCSQVTIPHKAHLFVPVFNYLKRITGT
jgi:glycosyltransferase involved in cell wall biosynthesis